MTLEEMKELIRRQAETESAGESVEGEVVDPDETDDEDDGADGYLKALYMLEDAAELMDDLIDSLDHRIPIGLQQRLEMKRLSNEIVNFLIDADDDDDDDEDDEESEV